MKVVPAPLQTLLNRRRFATREFIRFDMGSGTYGFWTGEGLITYDSVAYKGAADIIKIAPITGQRAGYASDIKIFMSSVPMTGVTPSVLQSIFTEDYKNKPVFIFRASLDPVTFAISDMRRRFKGRISHVTKQSAPDNQAVLIFHCVSREMDVKKTGYRIRSSEDQALIDPADRFFDHVAKEGIKNQPWGSKREPIADNPRDRPKRRSPRRF